MATANDYNCYWCEATYGGQRIAKGLANIKGAHFFAKNDISWQFLKPSDTEKTEPRMGRLRFWHIEVEGSPTLRDAAWQYINPPDEFKLSRGGIALRAHSSGDAGFGPDLPLTGEPDGVRVDEAWFG